MAVTPVKQDSKVLAAAVTSLTSAISAAGNGTTKEYLRTALDSAQRELVDHYMAIGRITAATILSTLS